MKIGDLAIDSILIGDLAINKYSWILCCRFNHYWQPGHRVNDYFRVCNVLRWDHIQWNYCSQKRWEDGVYIASVLIFSYIRQYQFIPVNVLVHYVID